MFQARLDGFTLSLLKPYPGFSDLEKEARELWRHYCDVLKPVRLMRVALLYINRLELPIPMPNFNKYILTVPEVAPGLPQGLSRFLMQLTIPQEDDVFAHVTLLMEPAPGDQTTTIPIIFDIDVFKETSLAPESPELWDTVNALRFCKNDIFFKSLTAEAIKMYR
ncbi:MAG: TIGR04255 family protein [Candidatus Eremiobacteraeota bacterium]|nr:TIGR04255 family protein [Candidatus Eremiobacteraeota bacterium]